MQLAQSVNNRQLIFGASFALLLILHVNAYAQHPSEIQALAASGEHFEALIAAEKMPERKDTPESAAATARSAWALSLPTLARNEFDRALLLGNNGATLTNVDQARIHLSRAILEYQEGKYEIAALYAERAANKIDLAGPLRAQAWSLWGESLFKLGKFTQAEENYRKALEEAEGTDIGELNFLLGKTLRQLGRYDEARQSLESVPMNHDRSPEAIRELAELALEGGKYESAIFWLQKGRELYQTSFIDSWVDFALTRAAVATGNRELVRATRRSALQRFPASDSWVVLLEASAENFEWGGAQPILPNAETQMMGRMVESKETAE